MAARWYELEHAARERQQTLLREATANRESPLLSPPPRLSPRERAAAGLILLALRLAPSARGSLRALLLDERPLTA